MHSIIATLFGPIFSKELIEMARRQRYYLSRVVYGVALLLALLAVGSSYKSMLGARVSISEMARIAESFSTALYCVQFVAVFIFVPLFLGGVVAGEREERTLEQLFTTELSSSQIVLGKLASRIVGLLGLMACGLPVLSIIQLFGGIDPGTALRALCATLLAIVYASAHALYFSTITRNPLGALVRTYWWMAVWLVGLPITLGLLLDFFPRAARASIEIYLEAGLMEVNPVAAFVIALDGFAYNRMVAAIGSWFYPSLFVLPSLWSLFLIWRAVRRLRADPTPFRWLLHKVPFVGSSWRVLKSGVRRSLEVIARPIAWLPALARRARFPVANPLWLRARQAAVYDREGYIRRIQNGAWWVAGFFLAMTAAVTPSWRQHGEMSAAFLGPTWLALALLTTLIAAGSLVGDRRRGFLELVLVTPLTAREIVDGAALAVWQHIKRLYWLPWVLCLPFCLSGASSLAGAFCSLLTGSLFLALLTMHGVACALVGRTLPGALGAAFLLPLASILGTGLMIGMLGTAHGPGLWLLCSVGLPVSWLWVWWRATPGSVASFLTAAHISIAALFSCWTSGGNALDLPVAAMHPGYLTMVTLAEPRENWFYGGRIDPLIAVGCYWTALVVNLVGLRWWLIRQFDRFVDRTVL